MANKFDLERMMNLNKNGSRAIGSELEKQVSQNDKKML